MLEKTFTPASIETRWYRHWEDTQAFRPARPDARPYTIVLPPPNVTGTLHIGHALNQTLQDILIRRARMQGRDALWQPGTDHAGIATQMVVERRLATEGYDPNYGARPLRRLIGRAVETELSKRIVRGEVSEGSIVKLTAESGKIDMEVQTGG